MRPNSRIPRFATLTYLGEEILDGLGTTQVYMHLKRDGRIHPELLEKAMLNMAWEVRARFSDQETFLVTERLFDPTRNPQGFVIRRIQKLLKFYSEDEKREYPEVCENCSGRYRSYPEQRSKGMCPRCNHLLDEQERLAWKLNELNELDGPLTLQGAAIHERMVEIAVALGYVPKSPAD